MNFEEAYWLDAERPDQERYLTVLTCGHEVRTPRRLTASDVYPCKGCHVLRAVTRSTEARKQER